jgi:hypothetical protein
MIRLLVAVLAVAKLWGQPTIEALNVKAFGAIGDGRADDTAAIAATLAAARAAKKSVFIPAGTYLTDTITGISQAGMTVSGEGAESTILKSRKGTNVIETTGASLHSIAIKDLKIDGSRGASNHGIYFHDNRFPSFEISLSNLTFINVGGRAIYLPSAFSLALDNVQASSINDNAIEIGGGPAVTLRNVYVHGVGAAKAAYRIYSGNVTLIGCNGIDSGTTADWGVFGRSVAEDGVDSYAFVVFIGDNIESFTRYGVRFKTSSTGSFYGTTFWAPATGTVQALRYDSGGGSAFTGIFDAGSSISSAGAAWTNGVAIHSATSCPALLVYQQVSSDLAKCYSESVSLAYPTLNVSKKSVAYGVDGVDVNYLTSPDAYFAHISGQGMVPGIRSGFGAAPKIAGFDSVGTVVVGSGGTATTGVIAWGAAYEGSRTGVNCHVRDKTTASLNAGLTWTETKTTLTIASSAPFGVGDVLAWICAGF